MNKELLHQALVAMELAKHSNGKILTTDPPQLAWKANRVDRVLDEAIAAVSAALVQEQDDDARGA